MSRLALTLAFGLLSAAAQSVLGGQSFLREPFDQVAKVGEHVTLPCRVVDKQGVLQWTRDDFGLGSDRLLDGFKRYIMTGSDEEGDYTLDINPVSLEDDARFQCQVGAAEGVTPIRSRYAQLTVLVPPDPPMIFPLGETYKTVEGREVELRCESHGGKPASEITWYDNELKETIETGVQTISELMSDGKRFKTISVLRFKADLDHNGRNITCQAQNSADSQPHTRSIRLQVHYPPHVTLTSNRGEQLLEGDSVRFECNADANPASEMTFKWYVGGVEVRGQEGSDLFLDAVDRRHHNNLVRCEVTNPIGRTEQTAILDISYSPVFLQRPENVAGSSGERATLRCKVDSNPAPSYAWYHVRADTRSRGHLIGSSANLTLPANANTVGEYECVASADGYGEVAASAKLLLKGPPAISAANRVQHAVEGLSGHVECKTESLPDPDLVEWSFRGVVIDPASDVTQATQYAVVEKRTPEGLVSTLVIREVTKEDLGAYICTVHNVLGSDSALLELRKQTSMPLLVVIAGVLGGVILTVALILIVILCRKNAKSFKDMNSTSSSARSNVANVKDMITITPMVTVDKASKEDFLEEDSPPVSTVTSSDGVSNNSSEMKVNRHFAEDWADGSSGDERAHGHGLASGLGNGLGNGLNGMSNHVTMPRPANPTFSRHYPGGDFVDGGLPIPFEHQTYTQQQPSYYSNNLVSASSGAYGNFNHAYSTSPHPSLAHGHHAHTLGHAPSTANDGAIGRYSVHVSPPASSSATTATAAGISVKNYSFDYMPASAFSVSPPAAASSPRETFRAPANGAANVGQNYGHVDNYSVYVNKPHVVPVPVHEHVSVSVSSSNTSSGASVSSNNSQVSSLATHV